MSIFWFQFFVIFLDHIGEVFGIWYAKFVDVFIGVWIIIAKFEVILVFLKMVGSKVSNFINVRKFWRFYWLVFMGVKFFQIDTL